MNNLNPEKFSFACWIYNHARCKESGCICPCHKPKEEK